jgi:hypothetical protein
MVLRTVASAQFLRHRADQLPPEAGGNGYIATEYHSLHRVICCPYILARSATG